MKKWRSKNREYAATYERERKKRDPIFKMTRNLRTRLYYGLKRKQKSGHLLDLLGCSILELKQHIEAQFQNNMTWENYGEWHIDHIKPLASFDLEDDSQLKLACHYTNLQPLWAKDNLSKGAKCE